VIVSAVVVLRFIRAESGRLRINHAWLAIPATLLVGVSLGLPLFLYLRELQLERTGGEAAS
jgi:Terpene cyclase DEP1